MLDKTKCIAIKFPKINKIIAYDWNGMQIDCVKYLLDQYEIEYICEDFYIWGNPFKFNDAALRQICYWMKIDEKDMVRDFHENLKAREEELQEVYENSDDWGVNDHLYERLDRIEENNYEYETLRYEEESKYPEY